MIPPLIAETPSHESVPIAFDESDPQKMFMLDLIKERYEAIEHPFLTSSRDGFTYLIIPRTIVRTFPDAQQVATETPSVLPRPSISRG